MIGATLDKYEVLQKVGEGGMATVYRGRHCTLDRNVAIKVLHPHLSSSTRNRKRFAREARAIEHLRHDNILEIFDYSGLNASECYIITEFVEGDTLTTLLRDRGRLPSEVVAIIGLRLARALAYAHHEGILHRDLKPDNVMLRVDGTVKLMDFGIARFLDESQVTMTGALVGSPAFMSPEQAREGDLDRRSDLFSLGTMMFYLVAGSLPFTGSNASLILKNVIESNRPSVSEVAPSMSATLADVIERLMATNPDDRYNTADEVEVALQAVLAESNVDPDDDRWSLARYLDDAESYEVQLTEHLKQILILRGKERLAAGDHLAALRLFNRLLAIDEDNPEVLELVQGLHDEPEGRVGGKALLVVALALSVLGALGFSWVYISRTSRAQAEQVVPAPTVLAVPEPDADLEAPVPVPEPAPVVPEPQVPEPQPQPVADPTPEPAPRPGPRRVVSGGERTLPPPPEPEPIEGEDEEDEPGMIYVRANAHGTIYVDGKRQGRTIDGEAISLPPGEHEIEIRGTYIETWKGTVAVSPGEEKDVPVTLQAKKSARLDFPAAWGGECRLTVDGRDYGTLATLEYGIDVTQPDVSHLVSLACPDRDPVQRTYEFINPLGELFQEPS